VTLLGRSPGDLPVRTLAQLSLTVKNKAINRRVQSALSQLGSLRGWTPSEVRELAVDDHGLDPGGTLTRDVAGDIATVKLSGGKPGSALPATQSRSHPVPAPVTQHHEPELKELKELVKDIGATLAAERQRVEALLSEERECPTTTGYVGCWPIRSPAPWVVN
jgi:hypothetical protein